MVMRVMGRNGMPTLRKAGYRNLSMIGMKMIIVRASIFYKEISILLVRVLAIWTNLHKIIRDPMKLHRTS